MIIGLFKDAVSWLVSLAEVGAVIAGVLLIGLAVGMSGFWLLSRGLSKLGGPPELDPFEDEPAEMADPKVVATCPDDDVPPSKPGA
jgi:hypothetical protein